MQRPHFAKNFVAPSVVVVVDDYFHSGFPGVNEGCHRFLLNNCPRKIVSFAVGKKNLFLTTHSHHEAIASYLFRASESNAKIMSLHGFRTVCVDAH